MPVYYVDFSGGLAQGDGLTPESAKNSYTDLDLLPGDRVLFRRGSFVRGPLEAKEYVSYGAYGEGGLPTFCGSVDVSGAEMWRPAGEINVWKCVRGFCGDVGNLVFNAGECTAAFRWTKEELRFKGDFYSTHVDSEQKRPDTGISELYLYSEGNPAGVYTHIEAVPYGSRSLVKLGSGMSFESIRIMNSGVHGMAGSGDGISVRGCVFENIGGCPWNTELKIRFGNGFEIWRSGNGILIENCIFRNIYDSCVTHQGPGRETVPANGFTCRDCVFDTYGMAAVEYRDRLPADSVFERNVCLNAGCGFAMLGETEPRSSEIWPLPVGHHVFLWRIPSAEDPGRIMIRDNRFGPAPSGAAVYSLISPEAESGIDLKNNRYSRDSHLISRFGGKDYSDLADFQNGTGMDPLGAYDT